LLNGVHEGDTNQESSGVKIMQLVGQKTLHQSSTSKCSLIAHQDCQYVTWHSWKNVLLKWFRCVGGMEVTK